MYQAKLNFVVAGQWAVAIRFRRDSLHQMEKIEWMQDVLDERYSGTTPPYTSVNMTAGLKFQDGRYSLALKITNLGNQQIQQHIFGDILKRSVVGEFKVRLK